MPKEASSNTNREAVPPLEEGGAGGNAEVTGYGYAQGGEGGEAGQSDRGGRGEGSPFENLGISNQQLSDGSRPWDAGRGDEGGGSQSHLPTDS